MIVKKIVNVKKWIEGNLVAGMGAATAATVAIISSPHLVDALANSGINITIDHNKFNSIGLIALAGLGGAGWNWLKAKASKKADEANAPQ